MFKKIIAIILSSFIGIMASPEFLSASNSVAVNGINNAGIVETVIPEPEPEPVVYYAAAQAATPAAAPAVYVPQIANYNVTVYSASIIANGLSYSDIYKTEKLIYGHNSWNLLGNLVNRTQGEVFTITEGGVTRNYVVSDIAVYAKTSDGYLNNNRLLMNNIVHNAMGHDVALMTCYGTAYGNGDASHRLVIYADAI